MGKTNATYRDTLTAMEQDWNDYRRALRRQHQAPFDELWRHARAYADAGGHQNHGNPMVTALVSICLASSWRSTNSASASRSVGGRTSTASISRVVMYLKAVLVWDLPRVQKDRRVVWGRRVLASAVLEVLTGPRVVVGGEHRRLRRVQGGCR